MSDKRDIPEGFTGIWIPAGLYRFQELDSLDREIIGCIHGFNNGGKSFISISYLARLTGTHRTNVSRRVSAMVKSGFLETIDCNKKRGGSNVLRTTSKCTGADLNNYENELKPSDIKGSKGGCSGDAHPVAETHTRVAETHTDNKEIKKGSSSKPAEAGFDFDLVLLFLMNTFREAGYDVDDVIEKAFIEKRTREYQAKYKKPTESGALSYVQTGLESRHGVRNRSAKAAAARDKLNASAVNLITAQATGNDQKALAFAPKTTEQKLSDRSWAEGLDFDECLDFDE